MSRAIDADRLLEALNSIILDYTSEGKYPDRFGIDDAINLVEDAPTLTPPDEWVSVEERLPEHMKDVIVLYGGGEIDIDWVDSLGDFRFDNLFGRVTHWMPLPKSPKEDE